MEKIKKRSGTIKKKREDGKCYEKGNDDREIDEMSSLWKEDKGQL